MLKNVQNHSGALKNYLDMSDSLTSFKINYCTCRGKNTAKFLIYSIKLRSTKSGMHFWRCSNYQIKPSCHHLTLIQPGNFLCYIVLVNVINTLIIIFNNSIFWWRIQKQFIYIPGILKCYCAFFNTEFLRLFRNVQHFYPRLSGRWDILENQVGHVLWDTL